MAELDEAHLQFLSRLLIMEALDNYPDWLGGPESIRFMDRAHCFVQRFKDRNKLVWRMPTTIGQKRPAGYESKWRICSEFYYVKTKGIPIEFNYNGDETKVLHEPVSKKQLAKKGAKRVHAHTSGKEKEGNSVYLGTGGRGKKNRPFIIFKGSTAANRPSTMSGNTSRKRTIREQIERAKAHNLVDQEFDFWVNESGTMDEEAHCYMLQKHFKRVRREENQPSIRMSMLEDSHASHKTERVKRVCQDLNVQLCIISGGLTADAQLADRVYIRRFKRIHRAKLLRLLLNKWRLQKKRLTNKHGVVLQVLFNNKQKTIDDFQFYSSYMYTLPVQRDGYNCGIYVALYMAMIAQNNIQYSWPEDMQQFRYKLALAIEHNDVDYFFKRPEV